jgi:hypothetical protein
MVEATSSRVRYAEIRILVSKAETIYVIVSVVTPSGLVFVSRITKEYVNSVFMTEIPEFLSFCWRQCTRLHCGVVSKSTPLAVVALPFRERERERERERRKERNVRMR